MADRQYAAAAADPADGEQVMDELVDEGEAAWARIINVLDTDTILSTSTAYIADASPELLTVVNDITVIAFTPHVDCGNNPGLTVDGTVARTLRDTEGNNFDAEDLQAGITSLYIARAGSIWRQIGTFDKVTRALVNGVIADLATHEADVANPHAVTKAQVGLANANNTTDANKPVSIAQAAAIAAVQLDADNLQGDIAAHVFDVDNPHAVTKAQVGLANAANTTDANKPVSTAQAAAIAVVQADADAVIADLATHAARVDNPHAVTKAQVGLANAANTTDANKPVSTAQAAAIAVVQADADAVIADLATHEADTTNPHTVTKAQIGLGSATNTSDADKPVSTAQAARFALVEADVADNTSTINTHIADNDNPHGVTKADLGLSNVDNTTDANKPISSATATALAGKLSSAAGAVGTSNLAAGAVTGLKIPAGAIENGHIGDLEIQAGKIDVGAIEPDKLHASTLALHPSVAWAPERPGDGGPAAISLEGEGAAIDRSRRIVGTEVETTQQGLVVRVAGSEITPEPFLEFFSRRDVAVYATHKYVARWEVRRNANPSDPLNEAVELRINQLDYLKNLIASVRFGPSDDPGDINDPIVANGEPYALLSAHSVIDRSARISKTAGADILFQLHANTKYLTASVRLYGSTGSTDLGVIDITDITAATEVETGADLALAEEISARQAGDAALAAEDIVLQNQITDNTDDIVTLTDLKANKNTVVARVGLVIGSGDNLGGQININVPKASAADVEARISDASAITPFALDPTMDRIQGLRLNYRVTWGGSGDDALRYGGKLRQGWFANDLSPWFMLLDDGQFVVRKVHVQYNMHIGRNQTWDVATRYAGSIQSILAADKSRAWSVGRDGTVYSHRHRINKTLVLDGRRFNIGFGILAKDLSIIATRSSLLGAEAESVGFADYNSENLALRETIRNRVVTTTARFNYPNNLFTDAGQSNMTGVEGYRWPVIGTYDNNKSFGEYVWSISTSGSPPTFQAKTSSILHPLQGHIQNPSGGAIMEQSDVEAEGEGGLLRGPPPGVAAGHFFKRLNNNRRGLLTNSSNILIENNVAVGGRTIDELEEDHSIGSVEYWNIIPSLFSQLATLLGAGNFQVVAMKWGQGESEYLGQGSSESRADYQAKFHSYIVHYRAEAMLHSSALKPLVFVSQVGGWYTRDVDWQSSGVNDLFVGMAQLQECLDHPGETFMPCNLAMYWNKTAHRNYHGNINHGLKLGQVIELVIGGGQHWLPLMRIGQEHINNKIRCSYHVPHPPLKFKTIYENNVAKNYAEKGFWIRDSIGTATATDVSIYKETMIDITLSRNIVGDYEVYYGSKTNSGGLGNVADSDPTNPLELYTYEAASDYASVDIANVVDRPFSLENWAIADYYQNDFRLEI